ncbi:MAG: hypothetical protein ACR2O0_10550, partial [Rhizobiaceae bacterium]
MRFSARQNAPLLLPSEKSAVPPAFVSDNSGVRIRGDNEGGDRFFWGDIHGAQSPPLRVAPTTA